MNQTETPSWLTFEDVFRSTHTQRAFADEPVSPHLVEQAWELVKWGPTAFNCSPMRVSVIDSPRARQTLTSHMSPGNQPWTQAAPLLLVLTYDRRFTKGMEQMGAPEAVRQIAGNSESLPREAALMQAAYFLTALRALGLHVGPMTGADFAAIEQDLFASTGRVPFMVIVAGHTPLPEGERERQGRLGADQVITHL